MAHSRLFCILTIGSISDKEVTTMIYTKPEVAFLGNANAVIELTAKKSFGLELHIPHNTIPAYDLDE